MIRRQPVSDVMIHSFDCSVSSGHRHDSEQQALRTYTRERRRLLTNCQDAQISITRRFSLPIAFGNEREKSDFY